MHQEGDIGEFQAAIEALAEWLETQTIPYTLIGGIAVSFLAGPRATQDVDAVVWLDESGWAGALESANSFGLVSRINGAIEFARRARVFLLRHESSGISLDISLGALPFEREMIERAKAISRGGVTARVPTIEDLIVTKLVAHRPKDLLDVDSLLTAGQSLDLSRIRTLAREFADATDRPEILIDFERMIDGKTEL